MLIGVALGGVAVLAGLKYGPNAEEQIWRVLIRGSLAFFAFALRLARIPCNAVIQLCTAASSMSSRGQPARGGWA